ncbi:MAG TPA: potassium channel protein [Methylocella sp.]|nr:potassium channel protein [Methylocella sp.]
MRWFSGSRAKNLIYGVILLLVISVAAILAYMFHGWSFSDALFMTVVTVFTVGYDEVRPLDTVTLRATTITLIVLGCTTMIYLTGALVQFITFNEIQHIFGNTRMNKQIELLKNHTIICGFGRIGAILARELHAGKSEFVIIESNKDRFAEAKALDYLCMLADANEETSLKQAGIDRARALAAVVSSDPVNVFVTLTARSLNDSIFIVARGEEPSTEKKLYQAGANAVVLPAHIGAEQVASMILAPTIASAIQYSDRRRQMELDLRTLGLELVSAVAAEGSAFAGLTVEEIERQAGGSFLIAAIEHAGTRLADRPLPSTCIKAGDGVTILCRIGQPHLLDKFSVSQSEA